MSESRLQVVVFRESSNERTCAVLRCQRTETVSSGNVLQVALIRAVTRWIEQTPEGREALERSAGDFNIGDLMNELPEPTLEPFLEAEGVSGLEVEIYSGDETGWDFDDLLFDEAAGSQTNPSPGESS